MVSTQDPSPMSEDPQRSTECAWFRRVIIQGQLCGAAGRPPRIRPEIGLMAGWPHVAFAI